MTVGASGGPSRVHADIDALKGLREALVRFGYAQRAVAERADDAIEVTRASLEAKASRWQARLEQDRAALEACRAAAGQSDAGPSAAGPSDAGPSAAGRSAAGGDGVADCSAYARAVEQTAERLEHVRRWQQRVDQDASEFRGTASGFRDLLEVDLPRAEGQLLASITGLEAARRVETGAP
jgi:hypothetical protein